MSVRNHPLTKQNYGGKFNMEKTQKNPQSAGKIMTTKDLAIGAMIAALYVVLTYVANMFGLASGAIQVRISEALTILPVFTPAAIPGLFVGCILANSLTGSAPYDIIFGSIATLIGAFGTYFMRKGKLKYAACVPPIIANTIIVPFILIYVYACEDALWYLMCTVGAGEIISCGILGTILLLALLKRRNEFNL